MFHQLIAVFALVVLAVEGRPDGIGHGRHHGLSHHQSGNRGSVHSQQLNHHQSSTNGHKGALAPAAEDPATIGNIVEVLAGNPNFSTLVAAVKAADLVDTLATGGPFTVFAPTNYAFSLIPQDTLQGLLKDKKALTGVLVRHVVPQKIEGKNFLEGSMTVATVDPDQSLTFTRTQYINVKSSAGDTEIVHFDIPASNGVVHAIGKVI